jgi:hypothetical protein
MRSTTSPNRSAWLLASLFTAFVLIGCSGKNWFSYTGWEAKPENRYALKEGGPHAVVWKSPELDLHYRYRLEGDRLYVEGDVVRQNRIEHFQSLKAWINIHILDENGVIIETHRLWSQYGSQSYGGLKWNFKQSWQLPPGNEAVGFSFSGVAGYGGENSPRWRFWQLP